MRVYRPKACPGCAQEYVPTGSTQVRCVPCHREKKRAYNLAYREANRERLVEADRNRYTKEEIQAKTQAYMKKHAEEIKARKRAYYLKNKERIAAKEAARYEEKRELIRQQQREWQQRNPDAARARSLRRRARKAAVEVVRYSPAAIFERDGWCCRLCGDPLNRVAPWPAPDSPSIDHVIPLSHGGADVPENVQAAHLGCNLRKGRKVTSVA